MARPAPAPALLALLALALAGCLGAPPGPSPSGLPSLPALPGAVPVFGGEVVVDPDLGGAEPSLVVDREGRIFVAAPTGLVSPVTSGRPQDLRGSGAFWRSLDGGLSFQLLEPVVLGLYGPSFGGGDSDIAVDAEGRVYAIDLWLGNVGFLSSGDHGETWDRGTPAVFAVPGDDRQWLDVKQDTGEVYVVVNHLATGLWVAKSSDGGQTFPQQTLVVTAQERQCNCPPGVLAVDQASGAVYVPYTNHGFLGVGLAASRDGGRTWELGDVAPLAEAESNVFPALAVDTAGNLYLATTLRERVVLVTSRDGGATWSEPAQAGPLENGGQIFPWVVAGSPGRAAVSWYETTRDAEGDRWDVRLATTLDALAPQPSFAVQTLNREPLLRGPYDRDVLADFFEIAMGPDGSVHAVWNALPEGAERQVIAYARQTAGEGLLEGVAVQAPPETPAPAPGSATAPQCAPRRGAG